MGFFSAIKNLFGQKSREESPQDSPPESTVESLSQREDEAKIAASEEMTRPMGGDETPVNVAPSPGKPVGQISAVQDDLGKIREEIEIFQEDIERVENRESGGMSALEMERIEVFADELAPEAVNSQDDSIDADLERLEEAPAVGQLEERAPESNAQAASAASDELLVRLREAPAKLSAWLSIILEEVDEADDLLWSRLRFLLGALEAPQAEAESFLDDFRHWLERMEYRHVDEFRSELQYRLALALDLEDEEDERARLMVKLSQGLAKTREQFGKRLDMLFSDYGELDQEFWNELEELFIMADIGYETSVEMITRLKERARRQKLTKSDEIKEALREELEEIFHVERRIAAVNKPEVILMIGVNGVGKTTTIAKLAYRDRMRGKKVLIAAADTFRAAAIEQLQVWADRAGVDFFARGTGAEPAAVAWEALEYARVNNFDIVYIDTAGRLQTKVNLMEELGKVRQVIARKHPGAPHRSILVLDATTGQNALSQAKLFREKAGADELILTKIDGTARGGVAIAVAMREKLPITYVGMGEKMEDLRPFNGGDYARALLGEK